MANRRRATKLGSASYEHVQSIGSEMTLDNRQRLCRTIRSRTYVASATIKDNKLLVKINLYQVPSNRRGDVLTKIVTGITGDIQHRITNPERRPNIVSNVDSSTG